MYQSNDSRPKSLNLRQIKFCQNAWLSALHRITGAVLITSLFLYLILFSEIALGDIDIVMLQNSLWIKWLNTLFWMSLYLHWLSGIRHLLSEHFLSASTYQKLTGSQSARLLIHSWWIGSVIIIWNFLL